MFKAFLGPNVWVWCSCKNFNEQLNRGENNFLQYIKVSFCFSFYFFSFFWWKQRFLSYKSNQGKAKWWPKDMNRGGDAWQMGLPRRNSKNSPKKQVGKGENAKLWKWRQTFQLIGSLGVLHYTWEDGSEAPFEQMLFREDSSEGGHTGKDFCQEPDDKLSSVRGCLGTQST